MSKITPHPSFATVEKLIHPLKEIHHDKHIDEHHKDDGHHDDHAHHDSSPRDTYKEEVVINSYNALIKQLKNDIHMQR